MVARPGPAIAQPGDEQPVRRGKRHLVPLFELGHHRLGQRHPELELMPFYAESLRRYGHGTCRRELACDTPQPNMIGVKHWPSLQAAPEAELTCALDSAQAFSAIPIAPIIQIRRHRRHASSHPSIRPERRVPLAFGSHAPLLISSGRARCRPVCHALLVIEPGVSRTSTPSGSRTVAMVTCPFGVGCATRRGDPPRPRPASRPSAASTSTKNDSSRTRSFAARQEVLPRRRRRTG